MHTLTLLSYRASLAQDKSQMRYWRGKGGKGGGGGGGGKRGGANTMKEGLKDEAM